MNIRNFLIFYVTFGFLFCNLFAAALPQYALIFIALRDAWIGVFLLLLIKEMKVMLLLFIAFVAIIGSIDFFNLGINMQHVLVYFYGLRDIMLIALLIYFLRLPVLFNKSKLIYYFIFIVIFLSSIQIFSELLDINLAEEVYNTKNYFAAKGIVSNLNGGIFGQRISAPFYSPALVCTMFSLLLLLRFKFLYKILLLSICILTSSKILALVFIFIIFENYAIFFFPIIIVSIPLINYILNQIIQEYPASIYSFHAASILDHIDAISFIPQLEILPSLLGYHSIASTQILGLDIDGPESLLIARILDLGIFSIVFILFLLYFIYKLGKKRRKYLILFLIICFFSSLSNHPVGYIPFLVLLLYQENQKKIEKVKI